MRLSPEKGLEDYYGNLRRYALLKGWIPGSRQYLKNMFFPGESSGLGTAGVLYAVRFMDRIAGLDYQTYDMVVVVKAEDKAEQLQDIANYRFGIQTASDTENTEKMIRDIETNLGRSVKSQEYDNIQEEAQALLSGRVEAAVYNNAFSGILEEYIDGYADQVKEIYRYGVEVPVETESQEPEDTRESFNLYISGISIGITSII